MVAFKWTETNKQAMNIRKEAKKLATQNDVLNRDLLYSWANGKKFRDIKEVVELENFYYIVKLGAERRLSRKLLEGEELSPSELMYLKLMKETLVDLYKLKFGEKRVQVNMGYKDIQDMIFDDNSRSQ